MNLNEKMESPADFYSNNSYNAEKCCKIWGKLENFIICYSCIEFHGYLWLIDMQMLFSV